MSAETNEDRSFKSKSYCFKVPPEGSSQYMNILHPKRNIPYAGMTFLTRNVCLIFLEQASFSLGMFIDMFHKPQILNWKKEPILAAWKADCFLAQRPKGGRKEKFQVKRHLNIKTYQNEHFTENLFRQNFNFFKIFSVFPFMKNIC